MVTAILSQQETDLNYPGLNGIDRPIEIVIRMSLSGSISIQVLADESEAEERLREALTTIRPLLELLHETVTALGYEPVGARN